MTSLAEQFGNIDIYLFDQLLRGNIAPGMRILDAGCGGGRNLVYLLRERYQVFAVDSSQDAIAAVRSLANHLAPNLSPGNFRLETLTSISLPDASIDAVLCNSVLHFSENDAHFQAMLRELWRVLRPGGILFCRLASTIGMSFERIEGRRHLLPGGIVWYLVDEPLLMALTSALGATLVDPLKTTVVQSSRAMTTWVLRKPPHA